MSEPQLLYFNFRMKGELLRFTAHAGGIKFEDERINFETNWKENSKASEVPFGQVPCLMIGNEWYGQRLAIALYLAKKGGLYPTSGDEVECLKYDSLLFFTEDILNDMIEAFWDKKLQKKPETFEKVKTETLPKKLPYLEDILKKNGTGYLVGNKLSVVDLSAFDILEHIQDIGGKSYLNPYPKLKALFERVGRLDAIKIYLMSRPPHQEGYNF